MTVLEPMSLLIGKWIWVRFAARSPTCRISSQSVPLTRQYFSDGTGVLRYDASVENGKMFYSDDTPTLFLKIYKRIYPCPIQTACGEFNLSFQRKVLVVEQSLPFEELDFN